MDHKEEERLLRLYNDVSSDVSSIETDESDPFEDKDGEYDVMDPTYQPDGNESSDSTASNNSVLSLEQQGRFLLIFKFFSLQKFEFFFIAQTEADKNKQQIQPEEEGAEQQPQPDNLWFEDLMEIPDFMFDNSTTGVKLDFEEDTTPFDVFKKL